MKLVTATIILLGCSMTPVIAEIDFQTLDGDPTMVWTYAADTGEMHITGQITSEWTDVIASHDVTHLVMDTLGGEADAAIDIATHVSDNGITTEIAEGGFCLSGCVPIFAAGVERIAHPSSEFAVHFAWGVYPVQSYTTVYHVDMNLTRRYFDTISEHSGADMYEAYLDRMLDQRLVLSVEIQEDTFQTTTSANGLDFPWASFWNPDLNTLVANGLVTNIAQDG